MCEAHGIRPDFMDLTADPGKDFNRFVNGSWIDQAQIPAEYPRWGAFLILNEQALNRVREILNELSARTDLTAGSIEQKIGDLFASGMDDARIEALGAKPLAPGLAAINRIRRTSSLVDVLAQMHLNGASGFFGFGSSPDFNNSSMNIAHIGQAGLGLPDRDYYLKDDAKSAELRDKYQAHVARMFELAGEKPYWARKHAAAVMALETELAKIAMSKVDRRDPSKITNSMTLDAFCTMLPNFPMRRYFAKLGAPSFDSLNVMQPDYLKGLNALLGKTKLSDVKAYLRWKLIGSMASCLSSDFVTASFNFYSATLQGTKEQKPRWKRMTGVTESILGEAIGQIYVAKHFPPEAKARMMELIANLRSALTDSINELTWMSAQTRTNALAKLDSFVAMIGYPDKWQDFSELTIDRTDLVGNVRRASLFGSKLDLEKIGKPVDKLEWHMTPQTVNAYYSPQTNQIVFPAAILQPPFFDMLADDATNYGGIGVVIGHEITHGFDDQGSKYDGEGNLKNWWTETDSANFDARIALIKEQFSGFTVAGGAKVNGDLVAGEAAADLGGVALAYRALQKALAAKGRQTLSGYTDEQRFFISFGQIWASKVTPEYEQHQVATDPHPPAQFRVNGTLAHVSEFPKAFGLPDDCPLMLPTAKRCQLW